MTLEGKFELQQNTTLELTPQSKLFMSKFRPTLVNSASDQCIYSTLTPNRDKDSRRYGTVAVLLTSFSEQPTPSINLKVTKLGVETDGFWDRLGRYEPPLRTAATVHEPFLWRLDAPDDKHTLDDPLELDVDE